MGEPFAWRGWRAFHANVREHRIREYLRFRDDPPLKRLYRKGALDAARDMRECAE